MIQGRVDPESGAFLAAQVRFPGSIDDVIEVEFLVDTGTGVTCLMPAALDRLSAFAQSRLSSHIRPGALLSGIGGVSQTFSTPASIALNHDSGDISVISLDVSVIVDRRYFHIPSIIGRDVLFLGRVSATKDGVTLDVEPGAHVIPA